MYRVCWEKGGHCGWSEQIGKPQVQTHSRRPHNTSTPRRIVTSLRHQSGSVFSKPACTSASDWLICQSWPIRRAWSLVKTSPACNPSYANTVIKMLLQAPTAELIATNHSVSLFSYLFPKNYFKNGFVDSTWHITALHSLSAETRQSLLLWISCELRQHNKL